MTKKRWSSLNMRSGRNLIEVKHSQGNWSENGELFLSLQGEVVWKSSFIFHLPNGSLVSVLVYTFANYIMSITPIAPTVSSLCSSTQPRSQLFS